MPQIERSIEIAAPIGHVFAFVADIQNHVRVVPPETQEELLEGGHAPLRLGSVVTFRAFYHGRFWTMTSKITEFDPPDGIGAWRAYFRDVQEKGPFAVWTHDRLFESTREGYTLLTDRFAYAAPWGPLGRITEARWLNARMQALIEHMQARQKELIEAEQAAFQKGSRL